MAKQSPKQEETVERVMHAFKHGQLRTRGDGPKVKNPKQAIAIALHEAGASKGRKTKAELYAQARAKNIPGRSRMDKGALERALAK